MADWYYTDFANHRMGPFSQAELVELNDSGTINAETPVWKEGLQGWTSVRFITDQIFTQINSAGEVEAQQVGVCAFSGKVSAESKLVPYGDAFIAK